MLQLARTVAKCIKSNLQLTRKGLLDIAVSNRPLFLDLSLYLFGTISAVLIELNIHVRMFFICTSIVYLKA